MPATAVVPMLNSYLVGQGNWSKYHTDQHLLDTGNSEEAENAAYRITTQAF